MVAHPCNPNCLGDWDWEDWGLRSALAVFPRNAISKIIRAKWTGGVAQVVEHLLCEHEALIANPNPTKK
jgi:hypothetical protein